MLQETLDFGGDKVSYIESPFFCTASTSKIILEHFIVMTTQKKIVFVQNICTRKYPKDSTSCCAKIRWPQSVEELDDPNAWPSRVIPSHRPTTYLEPTNAPKESSFLQINEMSEKISKDINYYHPNKFEVLLEEIH